MPRVFEVTIKLEVSDYNPQDIEAAINCAIDNNAWWSEMLECDADVEIDTIKDLGEKL